MRCHRVQKLLPDYIGDELSATQREHVEEHLKACPDCRAELAALQGVWEGLAKQPLPQKGEEFWEGFTTGVMREVRRKRPIPEQKRSPFLFPGWKVLLPAAATVAVIIVGVITFKGVLGPEQGEWVAQDEEIIVEIARSFSVAPLATEEEDTFDRGVSLNGLSPVAQEPEIALKETEVVALTEALTQLFGEEDLYENMEELEEGELEEFDRLLSFQYPYT